MRQFAQLVRPCQKPNFTILVECVVKMYKDIHITTIGMFVKRIILVHGEWMPGLWWFDVHRRVM